MHRIATFNDPGGLRVLAQFSRDDVRTSETPFGTVVELDACDPSGELGGPALPSCIVRVALPPRAAMERADVRILDEERIYPGPTLVVPLQRPAPGGRGDHEAIPRDEPMSPGLRARMCRPTEERPRVEQPEPLPRPQFEPPRTELYEREAGSPRPAAHIIAREQIGLTDIAVLQLNPIRLGLDGGLRLITGIEVVLDVRSTEGSAVESRPNDAFVASVKSRAQAQRSIDLARLLVSNPEAVWDYSRLFPNLVTNIDYLIITDDELWDAGSIRTVGPVPGGLVASFERLADWKRKRGLRVRLVTLSDIVAGVWGDFKTGARDLQEVIRNFVKFAHENWGVAWLLLGGDVGVIPVRNVIGAIEGGILPGTMDPPDKNRSFWTGTFLKMSVESPGTEFPGNSSGLLLVRPDNGQLIPYDPTGTSAVLVKPGWYFTTNDTYTVRSPMATPYVRVNGPAAQINAPLLQWIYEANTIPTDLYYASLVGPNYSLPGLHDWDGLDNGLYGQHVESGDFDGVQYRADVSVGRAPVSSAGQANVFVSKVLAYEQFRTPDGTPLNPGWTRKLLLASANWGVRTAIEYTNASVIKDNQYGHQGGAAHSLIKLAQPFSGLDWRLLAEVTPSDVRVVPYDRTASAAVRGWRYVLGANDLTTSELSIDFPWQSFKVPMPTNWVAVFGQADELIPQRYLFDQVVLDGSLVDQEELREQFAADLPAINNVMRLYEDDIDMPPAQAAAAPLAYLTVDRMREQMNAGPHFVSLSGHGNWDGCCGLSYTMAAELTNGYHTSIVYADACLTNKFDTGESASEYLLRNPKGGAVAYVGNTRMSWQRLGDDFQRAFFHRLTQTRHLGLLNDTRCVLMTGPTGAYRIYNKWAIFSLNLLGDPEMPVWTGVPGKMVVKFDPGQYLRRDFVVTVQYDRPFSRSSALPGVSVHIQQGEFSRIATTDANGRAKFNLTGSRIGSIGVSVTAIGYVPFLGEAVVRGPAWVSGYVRAIAHQHPQPDATSVCLELDPPVDGSTARAWQVRKSLPDYEIILDAVTDAYIGEQRIHLRVDTINEGGSIERFRFGEAAALERLTPADLFAGTTRRPPPEAAPAEPPRAAEPEQVARGEAMMATDVRSVQANGL